MNNLPYIDILILAMIAIFIINRLKNTLGKKTGNESDIIEKFTQSLKKQIKGINKLTINDLNNIDPYEKVLFFFGSDDIRRGDIDSIKEYLALFDISVAVNFKSLKISL